MSAQKPTTAHESLSTARLVKDLMGRYDLRSGARMLVVYRNPRDLVSFFRSSGVMAFGLFDGPAPPRDPYAKVLWDDTVPQSQPAVLHQSLPFPAHSFDGVVLQDSDVYHGSLTSPEACTATANLLASLKPGQALLYTGSAAPTALFRAHLSAFPGTSSEITLGAKGIGGLLRRLLGRGTGPAAVQFTIPSEAISRLEWHRLARQVVLAGRRQPAA